MTWAESLGYVESLAELLLKLTHAAISVEFCHVLGTNEGLIRVSVGIEDIKDWINGVEIILGRAV